MSTLLLTPDAEKLLSAFLRADADVSALISDHIYTVFPHNAPDPANLPFARLTLLGGPQAPMQTPRWLTNARIQVDVWAKPKATARLIAATMIAACSQRIVGTHTDGVVTACDVDAEPSYLADSDLTDPPTPRYFFQLVLAIHPHPA